MKRTVLALLVCLAFASAGFAQQNAADQPASKEDVVKYMDVTHQRKLMDDTMAVMTKQMHQMLHEQLAKIPNVPPGFEAREIKMMDDMFQNFPFDEMLEAIVPIYQRHFTKGDVDALTAFYTTPTGQKMLNETPAIMAETMQSVMPLVQKMVAKAMERVQDEVAQLQKESEANSKKPSPPASN